MSLEQRFAATLEDTERLPRAKLEAYRNDLLRRLASFAYSQSPFYRDRLEPLFARGDGPDLRRWHEIPILRRADLETDIDRINPSELPPEIGNTRVYRTSGTIGRQLTFRTCTLSDAAAFCMMHRMYRWHGFDISAPLASIRYYGTSRPYPDGITEQRWSAPCPPAQHYTIDLHTPAAELIEWLARRRPRYLLTFPSKATDLAEHPDFHRIADLQLGAIIAISEIVTADARALVRERFGCSIAQIYACAEMGCIAVQSPDDDQCVVCEESVFVELLDEAGEPVRPGEPGRVVLTSLYNYATPFIRYEIGDYAVWSETSAPSAPALARLERVEGRARNALVGQDGRRLWAHAVLKMELFELFKTQQLQIRQTGPSAITINYIANDLDAPPESQAAERYFTRLLGQPITLNLETVAEIPRPPGGKREQIVRDF
jgi:phenylacetate-CoA ligase